MSHDLNALVEEGKNDILHLIRKDLFAAIMPGNDNGQMSARFFLALKKDGLPLDLKRTREMVIAENYDLLKGVENGADVLPAMAHGAGRMAVIRECFAAVDRIRVVTEDERALEDLARFARFLGSLEKASVKIVACEKSGRPSLMPLDDIFDSSRAAV